METSSPSEKPILAVFDFDGTLIKGDSLWAFFAFVAGWPRVMLGIAKALRQWPREKQEKNLRTFVKAYLLRYLLAGKTPEQLAPAIERLARWRQWNEEVYEALREHHRAGHRIVIATGALDLYLATLLKGAPYHAVLCTEIGIEGGVITGIMTSGNCVRIGKMKRLLAYLTAEGPFTDSWGTATRPTI